MLRIDRDRTGGVRLTFVLRPDSPLGRVSVVGDFNEWRPGAHELRPRSNGTRSVAVTVPDGTDVRFRYLGEGGHWCNEIDHPAVRQDGQDSVVRASAADPAPAPKAIPKPAMKPAPKSVVKAASKSAPKPAVRSVVEATPKPTPKPAPKSAAKPAPKPATRLSAKRASKPAAKG